jgi:hypothetical protein
MNIHFPQLEKRSQVFSYTFIVLATFIVLSITLGLSRHTELHLSIPSILIPVERTENMNWPVAIPAPTPPVQQTPAIAVPEAAENGQAALVPQAILVPMPSVP